MRNHRAPSAIGWIVATALVTAGSDSNAAERLVIRTYDNFGVVSEEMETAHAVAGLILREAEVQVVWRDCSAECADGPGSEEVLVRVVTAPPTVSLKSLGFAVVDVQQGSGMLATVYADRVNLLAARIGLDRLNRGTLLGRAIAHEIGHLLLGTARHSTGGLMRALWSARELERDVAADWEFSADEAARIRRAVSRRACGSCSIIAQGIAVWPTEKPKAD